MSFLLWRRSAAPFHAIEFSQALPFILLHSILSLLLFSLSLLYAFISVDFSFAGRACQQGLNIRIGSRHGKFTARSGNFQWRSGICRAFHDISNSEGGSINQLDSDSGVDGAREFYARNTSRGIAQNGFKLGRGDRGRCIEPGGAITDPATLPQRQSATLADQANVCRYIHPWMRRVHSWGQVTCRVVDGKVRLRKQNPSVIALQPRQTRGEPSVIPS
jgi:hypothetical protein